MTSTAKNLKIHQGRNVKRFREMLGIKQDTPIAAARSSMYEDSGRSD